MHRESSPPNIYLRTSEQPNEELYKNSLALSDGSEVKTAQNSTNHVIKDPTRKAPILGILWLQVMEVVGMNINALVRAPVPALRQRIWRT